MRKLFVAVLAIAGFVACNKDVIVDVPEMSAIEFDSSFVEAKTRAAVDPSITTESINAFDVWGYMTDASGVVFDGERVTKGTDDIWSYANLQYWMPSKSYYFHAVAPVDDANIVVDTKDVNTLGLGKITFTNVEGATDLLYASKHVETDNTDPYYENASTGNKVGLQFMHLLSKIKFSFTNGFTTENATLKVKNIIIKDAPSVGEIYVNTERNNFVWNITQEATTALNFGDVNGGEALAATDTDESANERLTIPADETRSYIIEFDVELYLGTQLGMEAHKVVSLENQKFEIGKSYNITATINHENISDEALQPIEFTVVEVEDWDEGVFNGNIDYDDNQTPGDDTVEPEQPVEPEVKYTSVADFLAASVDDATFYTLKGTITRVANTSYGNFDLTDETGTVYVYGLYSEDGATNKYWATSGAKLGDDIVISAKRGDYNGSAQATSARFVEILPGTVAFYTVDPSVVNFASAGGEKIVSVTAYNTDAAVTATSDNAKFTATVNGYNVTIAAPANELEQDVIGNVNIKVGDLAETEVKVTLAAKPAAGVVEGGQDDFDTLTVNTSYTSGETSSGWVYTNAAIHSSGNVSAISDDSKGLTINGKTTAQGTITSPVISTGCGTLKFNYAFGFSESNGISFHVAVMQDGAIAAEWDVVDASATKNTAYTFEKSVNVAGNFQIVITNNSPSNSTSNKDRYTIWDVVWTGYNN